MNTDLTLLRAFVEVARCSSFGRAAEGLHLDPSTVSRQVAQLERRLGLKLFERTTRQVWLTDAGRALLTRADEVLAAAETFERTAAAVDRQHRGELVIGFQVHAINATVLGWVAGAEAASPGLSVRLQEGNFTDPSTGLRDQSCDLAFVFLPFDTTGIETAPLYELPWLMFLPSNHRLAAKRSVELAECLDEPWGCAASDDQIFCDYWLAVDVAGDRTRPPSPAFATPEAALAHIATGRAIGTGASARPGLHLDGVVAVPVADERCTTVALAWVEGQLSSDAERLRDAVLDRARQEPHPVGT
jgi:DNA-binding transcriptional LysR family regulator